MSPFHITPDPLQEWELDLMNEVCSNLFTCLLDPSFYLLYPLCRPGIRYYSFFNTGLNTIKYSPLMTCW
ncbi:hypothetical protein XENTR_v10003956 [Xenopus tropicalis]|nr:hypothetical protein XENTR_v10003956 [Xenopus tropicalis]